MKNLLTVLFLYVFFRIRFVNCHEDPPDNKSNFKDDKEIEEILRRKNDFFAREWQYEGLPIDAEAFRRSMVAETVKTKTTPTTSAKPTKPPTYRRIYNAEAQVSIKDHPYMAALLVDNQLWCGGAIISPDSILTAAHCLQLQYNNRFFREYYKMLSVRVGSANATANGVVYQIKSIYFHPNYKPQNLDFNFAILKLDKNITLGKEDAPAQVIPLSRRKDLTVDQNIDFLGWGSEILDSGKGGKVLLQKVTLPVYETMDCREVYGKELVARTNFCAGYISIAKNVCNHDAGGPAVLDGELVGVLSFSNKRCDEPDKPAVFANVGVVTDWLKSVINKEEKKSLRTAWDVNFKTS